jgi:pimeloyl-ACP methyl ester carboxylesterase
MDLRPVRDRITTPPRVIAGAEDPATPPALGEQIAAAVAGARLVVVPGAAHLANVERADAVTDLLADFFGEPTPRDVGDPASPEPELVR